MGARIAALFVEPRGTYSELPDIELWDAARDARNYLGPWPVIAHPPCSRWCRLAGLIEARWGHKKGADDGCFASALLAVRTFGGVLEHPAYSDAWTAFALPKPLKEGGWAQGACGGSSCYVEQGRYGHPAKKATWLYAFGIPTLPDLHWGHGHKGSALVSWSRNHVPMCDERPRIGKKNAARTPPAFRDALLNIARSVVSDYERCGECGFDHGYEPESAAKAHNS